MAATIRITAPVFAAMLAEARRDPDRECCGLLAGQDGICSEVLPAQNAAKQTATTYEIAPMELFALFREIRSRGLELTGIYHSHPHGENVPSPTDIAQANDPDVAYFILSPSADAARPARAFHICNGNVSELEIFVIDESAGDKS